jgi:hypothetical protein
MHLVNRSQASLSESSRRSSTNRAHSYVGTRSRDCSDLLHRHCTRAAHEAFVERPVPKLDRAE